MPSVLLSFKSFQTNTKKINDTRTINGPETNKVNSDTINGLIKAANPPTNKIFKILLPTRLPISISRNPFFKAIKATANSGREVPKATKVKPTKAWVKEKNSAIFAAESTTKLAPKNNPNKEIIKTRVSPMKTFLKLS